MSCGPARVEGITAGGKRVAVVLTLAFVAVIPAACSAASKRTAGGAVKPPTPSAEVQKRVEAVLRELRGWIPLRSGSGKASCNPQAQIGRVAMISFTRQAPKSTANALVAGDVIAYRNRARARRAFAAADSATTLRCIERESLQADAANNGRERTSIRYAPLAAFDGDGLAYVLIVRIAGYRPSYHEHVLVPDHRDGRLLCDLVLSRVGRPPFPALLTHKLVRACSAAP